MKKFLAGTLVGVGVTVVGRFLYDDYRAFTVLHDRYVNTRG
jgi:hypothetical protein